MNQSQRHSSQSNKNPNGRHQPQRSSRSTSSIGGIPTLDLIITETIQLRHSLERQNNVQDKQQQQQPTVRHPDEIFARNGHPSANHHCRNTTKRRSLSPRSRSQPAPPQVQVQVRVQPHLQSLSSLHQVVQAQLLPAQTPAQRRAKRLALWGFVVAAIMVIFLGVVLSSSQSTGSRSNNNNVLLSPNTQNTTSVNYNTVSSPTLNITATVNNDTVATNEETKWNDNRNNTASPSSY